MVHIPQKGYEARISGSVWKWVVCQNCQTEFTYLMTRQGHGSGTSWFFLNNRGAIELATRQAHVNLQSRLKREEDPVPCPNCGWYQPSMIIILRRDHHWWMVLVAGFLFVVAAVFFVLWLASFLSAKADIREASSQYGTTAAWAGTLATTVLAFRKALSLRVQPNDGDAQERIRLGQSLAITKAEFEKQQ